MSWHPASWRDRPARQLPSYPDAAALGTVQSCLRSARALASVAESRALLARLGEVAQGRAFLLQGGDCAESFAEFGADKVRRTFNLLLDMAERMTGRNGAPVVAVARIAGQFAKPRSAETEIAGDVRLPVYRGDIVNGAEPTVRARTPDPLRMLEAHRQACATVDLLKAYAAAAHASSSDLHRSARRGLGLAGEHAGGADRAPELFTSHEALLLPYEEALTRRDEQDGRWWSCAAHMLWLGDRTRQLDGAHVEFLRGIANPVGVKCGPTLDRDGLLRLVDALDPHNLPGRLVLIGRFGADGIGRALSPLMRATAEAGRDAIWACDPMHGNTITVGGRKTRRLGDIRAELKAFFAIARAEGVHPGGVHLELTGEDVTECIGRGSRPTIAADLARRYVTQCDPRLNATQAMDVAAAVARAMRTRASEKLAA